MQLIAEQGPHTLSKVLRDTVKAVKEVCKKTLSLDEKQLVESKADEFYADLAAIAQKYA